MVRRFHAPQRALLRERGGLLQPVLELLNTREVTGRLARSEVVAAAVVLVAQAGRGKLAQPDLTTPTAARAATLIIVEPAMASVVRMRQAKLVETELSGMHLTALAAAALALNMAAVLSALRVVRMAEAPVVTAGRPT